MKVLDLFSGIAGFSLGLERAGMETVAFCEYEPHAQAILKKHWPEVPIHKDVSELDGKQYRGTIDVVCGGFPCQDLSAAGKQAGIEGGLDRAYTSKCLELLASVCLDTQFLRTSQACLLASQDDGLLSFSMTWPRSGMMQSGTVCRLQALEWHTKETEFTFWPTPQAKDGQGYYITSSDSAKNRRQNKRQMHWIHHAILTSGQEGKFTANPRFSEEMMGFPAGWTDLQDSEML